MLKDNMFFRLGRFVYYPNKIEWNRCTINSWWRRLRTENCWKWRSKFTLRNSYRLWK